VVRPSWSNVEVGQHEIELVIDPKQAFGTGHHATTQLLIEWLEEKIRGGERILDLGTGSGILAMAALRLGAGCAVGLDIDPIAIDCARDYAKANGFGPELQFQVAAVHVPRSERFDLVVASLDRRTILESVPALTLWVTSGAILLLSGLLREDRNDVAVAFAQFGVAIRSFRERDGWLGIEMMQTEHCEGT
jgi:ribosomal protein L11 methyltransferase